VCIPAHSEKVTRRVTKIWPNVSNMKCGACKANAHEHYREANPGREVDHVRKVKGERIAGIVPVAKPYTHDNAGGPVSTVNWI
jgi:hypothetical protein